MKSVITMLFGLMAVLLGAAWGGAFAEESVQAYKPCNLDDLAQGILPTYVELEKRLQGSFSKSYVLGAPFDITPGGTVVKLEELAWVAPETMALKADGFATRRHQFHKDVVYLPDRTMIWRDEKYDVLLFGSTGAYGVLVKDDGAICERTIEKSSDGRSFMGSSRLFTLEPQAKLVRRPTGRSMAILYKGIDSGLLKFEMRVTNPSGEVSTVWEKSFDATLPQINLANFTIKLDKISGSKLTVQVVDENLRFLKL